MPTNRNRVTPAVLSWVLPIACLLLPATGCDNQSGLVPRNHPPEVRLTGGPANGDSAAFDATFFWHGWDEDGIVASYRYGLVDMVDHPEVTGPGDIPADG